MEAAGVWSGWGTPGCGRADVRRLAGAVEVAVRGPGSAIGETAVVALPAEHAARMARSLRGPPASGTPFGWDNLDPGGPSEAVWISPNASGPVLYARPRWGEDQGVWLDPAGAAALASMVEACLRPPPNPCDPLAAARRRTDENLKGVFG
jgi:hypothetical protein